nr:histidine kinase [Agromyces seonyuensis]
MLFAAFLAGRLQRGQHLADRAATVAASRAARAAARSELARELHDVVSHRLSYAVVEAEVIGTTTDDAEVRRLAGEIGQTGRAALAELRLVLAALAEDAPASAAVQTAADGADELDVAVVEARAAGQPVEVERRIPPSVPPGILDRTFAQIAREGLANAVRHAPGAPTSLRIEPVDGAARIVVENARPAAPPTGLTGGGFGLAALRERVELLGGDFEAAPTPAGGFWLQATIPEVRA